MEQAKVKCDQTAFSWKEVISKYRSFGQCQLHVFFSCQINNLIGSHRLHCRH